MALKGITVIEMAGLAPAPFCGMILADFGARVIRVDKPHSPDVDRAARGKQSVIVNLKKKEGVNVVKRLCSRADVLLEPFRPGVMEKLNLGPEILTKENPKLIYARLTGYGQSGPMSHKAGHDINYIATSGILSKLGRHGEKPYPPINLMADFAGGGLICALGIMMALFERSKSGKGQVIDANMVEGSAYMGTWLELVKDLYFSKERGQSYLDGGSAFYETYKTKDGKYMAVGALEPQFYRALLQGLNLDPDKVSQADDQDAQSKLFQEIFLTKTREEWTETFADLDACVTPVLSTAEAAEHPHNKQRAMFLKSSDPHALHIFQAVPAPRLSRTPAEEKIAKPLPEMGEHTFETLKEQGFTQEELRDLVSQGAICQKERL
ncbi:alpha-methylacyl-coa racemase [Plakobranchus ocellatus]|uniref:Alpha-methylacyl-coa racemase n=1 Tax=Plakobranchus ocellatus TaxID=259542 RepID=A0AAV3Z955_9GAST|nr:alpha-methylacyl-coa racemase [Plakobranchus ocellatus]